MKDLDTFIDEASPVLVNNSILKIYNIATSEPSSFLYVKLIAKDKHDMCYRLF